MPWIAERFKKCLKAHTTEEKASKLMENCGAEPQSASPAAPQGVRLLREIYDKANLKVLADTR